MTSKDTIVLVFGTFDIIHPGHQWFLKQASALGSKLVAAVARDAFISEWKGVAPVVDEDSRIKALTESGLVDDAVLSDSDIRTYGVVRKIRPDVICLGHDQHALQADLETWLEDHEDLAPRIEVLPPWKRTRYNSTRRNKALRGAVGNEGQAVSWGFYLLMVAAMAAFGFSWVSGKRISATATPAMLALIRFALTTICFIPLLLFGSKKTERHGSSIVGWLWTFAGAVFISCYNLLFFQGLEAGLAGKGGVIVTTLNPFFTFLIVSASTRTKPSKWVFAGIVLGLVGGLFLISPWKYSAGELLDSGNAAFLAAGLSWSLLTISSRRAQKHLGFGRFNFGLYAAAALMMLPFAFLNEGSFSLSLWPENAGFAFWADMMFIAAAVGAFGTGAYFMASIRLGSSKASAFTYLVPASALFFTGIFLGESPEMTTVFGGLLAILAVVLINRRSGKKK